MIRTSSLRSSINFTRRALATCAMAAIANACSTSKPFSYVDPERWNKVEMNTYDTSVVTIDGKTPAWRRRIMVDPGWHHIVFQTHPATGFTYSPQEALDIDIKPCTWYWFEAKRYSSTEQDFVPRVNHTEHISGCPDGSKGVS